MNAHRSKSLLQLFFAAMLSVISLSACGPDEGQSQVVVTVRPLYGLTAALMEGVATPYLLERSGDPHQAVLKPSDARHLSEARLVVWLGPQFEPGIAKRVERARGFALSDVPEIDLLPARRGAVEHGDPSAQADAAMDPHVWLSIARMRRVIAALTARLVEQDPDHAQAYRQNHIALDEALVKLSQQLTARMTLVRETPFLVHHDAYQYFESDYGLTPIAILEGSEHLPVSTRHMAEVYQTIEEARPSCLLVETEPPGKLALKVADDTAVKIVGADPLARALPPGPDLYQAALEDIASAFEACLTP